MVLLAMFISLVMTINLNIFVSGVVVVRHLDHRRTHRIGTVDSTSRSSIPLARDRENLLSRTGKGILFFCLSNPVVFDISGTVSHRRSDVSSCRIVVLSLASIPVVSIAMKLTLRGTVGSTLSTGYGICLLYPGGRAERRLRGFRIASLIPSRGAFGFHCRTLGSTVGCISPDRRWRDGFVNLGSTMG